MFVCICNALNETVVRRACVEGGAQTAEDVFVATGVRPECGTCVEEIERLVKEHRSMARAGANMATRLDLAV